MKSPPALAWMAKLVAYTVVTVVVFEVIGRAAAAGRGQAATAENGAVEAARLVSALAARGWFALATRGSDWCADLLRIVALAVLFGATRELDGVCKHLVAESAHRVVGALIGPAAAALARRARDRLAAQVAAFARPRVVFPLPRDAHG